MSARWSLLWLMLSPLLIAAGPFDRVELPDAWESRFWSDPAVMALLKLEPKAIADLVPKQTGLHFCRCPVCDSTEAGSVWSWSPAEPSVMTCVKCQTKVPGDAFPAKVEGKILEESIEVLPGIVHKYLYHLVGSELEKYPDERLYLAAKRDDLARQFLAKFALYAAVRHQEQPDPALALKASAVLARFAQVYPSYATHFDQPGRAKYLDRADLRPPYRSGYATAKWTWTASQNVPLNLVIAYAILGRGPEIDVAGRLVGLQDPRTKIERDLFRDSAAFILAQPQSQGELGLAGLRGVLAVGRLLNDEELTNQGITGLEQLSEMSFAHDGLWRGGDGPEHRRVVEELGGWIGRLLEGSSQPPMIPLARSAGSSTWEAKVGESVQQVSWPTVDSGQKTTRNPRLLGGSGLARLAVGSGGQSLDVDLRAPSNLGQPFSTRLALRMAVGGRAVLADLDESPPTTTGFERATASHNTVIIDGLNQGESPTKAAAPSLGGDPGFFAADTDFQITRIDDPRAYPTSATRYRQTLVAGQSGGSPYLISIFEVHGGLQHDQFLHAAAGSTAVWKLGTLPMRPISRLLPDGIAFLANAKAEDGRWFVQSYGEFQSILVGKLDRPGFATLGTSESTDLRVHLLNDVPGEVMTASTPGGSAEAERRATLMTRRRSLDGSALNSVFVTLYEPGPAPPLLRVGRVAATSEQIIIYVESSSGPQHIVVSLEPGTSQVALLSEGSTVRFNGQALRVDKDSLLLAGGTKAEANGVKLSERGLSGNIKSVHRQVIQGSRGSFDTDLELVAVDPLIGRVLRVRHGDGTIRGWTIVGGMPLASGLLRLFVNEEPGFEVEPATQVAKYYQFPQDEHPGPHTFYVDQIYRTNTKKF